MPGYDRAVRHRQGRALAVVEAGDRRHVIGLLTEAHARRRYADELEPRRRELSGE
jgi:chloride channel protein, CIC family